jgi:hypothetical protein
MTTSQGTEDKGKYGNSQNAMWIWGQFFMIPVTTLVGSIELLLRTMQEAQQVALQGMQVMTTGPPVVSSNEVEEKRYSEPQKAKPAIGGTNTGSRTAREEDKTLNENYNYCNPDPNACQCLKLWRYKVLFIKRDLEHAFDEAEDLVSDDVADITAWKIAEFIQKLGQRRVEVPLKWLDNNYPEGLEHIRIGDDANPPGSWKDVREARRAHKRIFLWSLPEPDKKYLRLFHQVLAEYTREEPEYDRLQIKYLKDIAQSLRQGDEHEHDKAASGKPRT